MEKFKEWIKTPLTIILSIFMLTAIIFVGMAVKSYIKDEPAKSDAERELVSFIIEEKPEDGASMRELRRWSERVYVLAQKLEKYVPDE